MTEICIFPECLGHKMNLRTARKKGTNTLTGGRKQQVWHCRECGGTWQTDEAGKIVQKKSRKVPTVEPVCSCPMGCVADCAGCRYNWEMNDKEAAEAGE